LIVKTRGSFVPETANSPAHEPIISWLNKFEKHKKKAMIRKVLFMIFKAIQIIKKPKHHNWDLGFVF
jgi:hypothetical protein